VCGHNTDKGPGEGQGAQETTPAAPLDMIRIALAARSTLAPTAVDHSGGTAPGCLGTRSASHQPRHGEFSLSKTVLPHWAGHRGPSEGARCCGTVYRGVDRELGG
jgi:hypothetical protein